MVAIVAMVVGGTMVHILAAQAGVLILWNNAGIIKAIRVGIILQGG